MDGKAAAPVFLCLLALSQLAFAEASANQLADFSSPLDATIKVEEKPLIESPQALYVSMEVENSHNTPITLYIIRQKNNEWEFVRLIGAMAPSTKTPVELEVELRYDKQSEQKTKYAIVGRGEDGTVYGKYFEIKEDWSVYEANIRDSLSGSIVTWVPFIAVLTIILIFITMRMAYNSKSEGSTPNEYTIKTLLFPEITGRPAEEKLADVIINPITMAFEALCVAVLVIVMFDSVAKEAGFDDGLKIMVLSAIGSFVVPFLYFAAAWYFEKREESKPLRFFAGMFVWGMFAAFLSLIITSTLLSGVKDASAISFAVVTTMLIAPVVEEVMKGIGVLLVSGHHDYNDTLTGLLLGFTCGVGFAFIENWFYFAFRTDPFQMGLGNWTMLILYRSIFNTLAHGFFVATVSTAIGYCKGIERIRKYAKLAFIPGTFLAITIHMMYNLSALADSFVFANKSIPFFIFNPMLIILLATLFFLVLVFATIDEKRRKEAAKREIMVPK